MEEKEEVSELLCCVEDDVTVVSLSMNPGTKSEMSGIDGVKSVSSSVCRNLNTSF